MRLPPPLIHWNYQLHPLSANTHRQQTGSSDDDERRAGPEPREPRDSACACAQGWSWALGSHSHALATTTSQGDGDGSEKVFEINKKIRPRDAAIASLKGTYPGAHARTHGASRVTCKPCGCGETAGEHRNPSLQHTRPSISEYTPVASRLPSTSTIRHSPAPPAPACASAALAPMHAHAAARMRSATVRFSMELHTRTRRGELTRMLPRMCVCSGS
jgi:hypothetical protein